MLQIYKEFWSDDRGSTALEYAVIALVISVFIIGSIQGMAGALHQNWTFIETSMGNASSK
jgi:Flp pilus assembly pilin Flp